MLVIGLTGGSGSGKGYISKIFFEYAVPSLDADLVYRSIVSVAGPCTEELASAFGTDVVRADGSLDRGRLAAVVFGDTEKSEERLRVLNGITHKYVLRECRSWIEQKRAEGVSACIIDAPQLYESGFDRECDCVVAVTAPIALRKKRIMERDSLSALQAIQRINAQNGYAFFRRNADFLVYNNGKSDPKRQVERICRKLGIIE